MPTFRIERCFSGWTQEDLGAAKLRSEMCALRFPGMRWIRSIIDADLSRSTCIYEAAKEQDIWDHAAEAKLPIESVGEVFELVPDSPPPG